VVQTIERTKATPGATWSDAQAWVRQADPVADAAARAIGGYSAIGTSQRREETYMRPFRHAYVNHAVSAAVSSADGAGNPRQVNGLSRGQHGRGDQHG
jgi:hypothetical protein